MVKSGIVQYLDGFSAPRTHLADSDYLSVGIEFAHAAAQFRQRDQLAANVGDLELELIANIEEKEVLARFQPLLQFFCPDLRNAHCFTLIRFVRRTLQVPGPPQFQLKKKNPPASSISGGGSQ
jgi:hypothetical protein